jgi:hypothetical protein
MRKERKMIIEIISIVILAATNIFLIFKTKETKKRKVFFGAISVALIIIVLMVGYQRKQIKELEMVMNDVNRLLILLETEKAKRMAKEGQNKAIYFLVCEKLYHTKDKYLEAEKFCDAAEEYDIHGRAESIRMYKFMKKELERLEKEKKPIKTKPDEKSYAG